MTDAKDVKIEPSWKAALGDEFTKEYFTELSTFVRDEYTSTKIFPEPKNVFRAFELCPFDKVKVVILGQDPYHGDGQANGLSFAVERGMHLPPSLKNIFTEIKNDLGIEPILDGDLSRWARQGVLLLNSTLTVRAHAAGSHQGRGWEMFTDEVVKKLSRDRSNIVFLLWGNYAREKGKVIDRSTHCVLEAPHPSPFSAHNGFFGCKHFSKANAYLHEHGLDEIDWH